MELAKDRRLFRLWGKLSKDEYSSAKELSFSLETSEKTVRRIVKDLDYLLKKHGAAVVSRHGCGYRISVSDQAAYQAFLEEASLAPARDFVPANSEERISFLLEYLLNRNQFVKLEDLAEKLYVSKNTLTADLKKVEAILEKHHLKILRKPNYGIALQGNEFDLRLCIAGFTAGRLLSMEGKYKEDTGEEIRQISEILLRSSGKMEFKVNEMAFQNLIVHIYVAMKRIERKFTVSGGKQQTKWVGEREREVAKVIVENLEQQFSLNFPEEEVEYIAIHLAGKQVYEFTEATERNLVIRREVSDLAGEMLQSVYDYFKIDFRGNLELRMTLCQHLVPLLVRIGHDMNLKNPLLKEVKVQYIFSYMLAAQACTVLSRKYGKVLSEDEVAYIALPFALALARQKERIVKKNVLFVCSTGKGSAELLVYKFKEEFGKYINRVFVCDLYRVGEMDFDRIDYIFTTVPIAVKVPVPILEVGFFPEPAKLSEMREILSSGSPSPFESYFRQDLFFPSVQGKSKEEVIRELCEKISKSLPLPETFYEAVLAREKLAKTDFGNLVALPHPYLPLTRETFVSVGILEQGILWTDNPVAVVLLVSISEGEEDNLQGFYQTIVKLISGKNYIKRLIKERSYQTLRELLTAAEREVD